jgi:hypothetical protein
VYRRIENARMGKKMQGLADTMLEREAAQPHPGLRPLGSVPDEGWTRALWMVTLVAAVMRFWGLGSWSFAGDEAFTVAHSFDQFSWSDLRPLAFAINRYVTIPLFGLTEFSLRLAPAIAGIIAVPVFGWAMARVYGREAGFFTALTIALSPLLLFHSQWARYYMQSFLVAGFVPFAVRFWLGGHGRAWLWVAAGCTALGWFLVPSTSFILPGLALWWVWNARALGGDQVVARLRRHWILAVIAVGMIGVIMLLIKTVVGVALVAPRYFSLAQLVQATVSGLTVPVTIAALAGLVLVWRDKQLDRPDRTFLPLVALGSAATYLLAFPFIGVTAVHIVSALAVAFAAAGIMLANVWRTIRDPILATAALSIILLSTSREVASYYVDGSRVDYRGAAHMLLGWHREDPGPVFAVSHRLINHYAPELRAEEVTFTSERDSQLWLDQQAGADPIWLILPEHRRGIEMAEGALGSTRGLAGCALKARIVRERFDYHVNAIRIYRCGRQGG